VVEFALGRSEGGRARFAAALEEDPSVQISRDLTTAELEREFAAVKTSAMAKTDTAPGTTGASGVSVPPESSDCPPEFPGCQPTEPPAAADADNAPRSLLKSNWLSLSLEGDALLLPSAADACAGGRGYTCFASDGSYYGDTPLTGADDQVTGGLKVATTRVLLGYDRVVGTSLSLGARLGYALGGGPQRPSANGFVPLHVEARAAYWLGRQPLVRTGFRFFVLVSGGMAQVDASVPVDVYASAQAYRSGQSQSYQAWKKTGLGFVAAGVGTMFAFTATTGIVAEAKVMEMFPTAATGFGLQMGYVVGL
jgi:hypothetical protein